jgi:hypothetical protein
MSNLEPNRQKRAKTGGRAKGVTNKFTGQLKDMILGALDEAGGAAYLVKQAGENPTAFLTLVGKVLPLQVNADIDLKATVTKIERAVVHAKHTDR